MAIIKRKKIFIASVALAMLLLTVCAYVVQYMLCYWNISYVPGTLIVICLILLVYQIKIKNNNTTDYQSMILPKRAVRLQAKFILMDTNQKLND